ncbi:MAG TPA: hemerythrin domain-containing protein [Gammaproteobacteria bacterium]|nr:hemerythrin domain-containing protein [Gammaproteobacteria bacterium]
MQDADPLDILAMEHDALARLYGRHQEALVTRYWQQAASLLEEYSTRLSRHIEIEQRLLLPHCDAVSASIRWQARVYRAEHERIAQLLARNIQHLAQTRQRGMTPAGLIALLDEERMLKHVLEHHHEREEQGLFAELRLQLPADIRKELKYALDAA